MTTGNEWLRLSRRLLKFFDLKTVIGADGLPVLYIRLRADGDNAVTHKVYLNEVLDDDEDNETYGAAFVRFSAYVEAQGQQSETEAKIVERVGARKG